MTDSAYVLAAAVVAATFILVWHFFTHIQKLNEKMKSQLKNVNRVLMVKYQERLFVIMIWAFYNYLTDLQEKEPINAKQIFVTKMSNFFDSFVMKEGYEISMLVQNNDFLKTMRKNLQFLTISEEDTSSFISFTNTLININERLPIFTDKIQKRLLKLIITGFIICFSLIVLGLGGETLSIFIYFIIELAVLLSIFYIYEFAQIIRKILWFEKMLEKLETDGEDIIKLEKTIGEIIRGG